MRVLVVEPYLSGSHAAWAHGYARHSAHQMELVALPGRFWRWRLRGSAVELAERIEASVSAYGRPDVVVISSLTDLAALLGLARRSLLGVPVVAYLHENQLAYPRDDATDLDAAMRTWTGLVAADRLIFNSHHHQRVVTEALPALRAGMPDGDVDLGPGWLRAKSTVVPVGIDPALMGGMAPETAPSAGPDGPLIVWNHRWDDDKAPDVFVRACRRMADDGAEFRVALLGADGWDGEPRRAAATETLGDVVAHSGHVRRSDYLGLLGRADVVVSTARHEFFGVSVAEAVAAGCVPLLPDRLSYPDLIGRRWHDSVLYQEGTFGSRLADVVADIDGARGAVDGLAASMERFAWPLVAARLDAELTTLVG